MRLKRTDNAAWHDIWSVHSTQVRVLAPWMRDDVLWRVFVYRIFAALVDWVQRLHTFFYNNFFISFFHFLPSCRSFAAMKNSISLFLREEFIIIIQMNVGAACRMLFAELVCCATCIIWNKVIIIITIGRADYTTLKELFQVNLMWFD